MTQDEIVESMARAVCRYDATLGFPGWEILSEYEIETYKARGNTILSALTAAGLVIVPREPTEVMLFAYKESMKNHVRTMTPEQKQDKWGVARMTRKNGYQFNWAEKAAIRYRAMLAARE